MKYCFNCGAKIDDENQNFCIICGADLKNRKEKHSTYKKENRKKYNPNPGESYNDYLKRINSPLQDVAMASEEDIEREKEAYINYDPNKSFRENKINYPKSELERHSPKSSEDGEARLVYDKLIISEGMFGKPAASTEGNFIVEGMYGRPKYYIDGDIIRENNQFGKPAYRIDGNYIREGMFGKPKYYIDGDLIRENNQFGKVVARKKRK